ncbi:tetratricopeptide repeat protein [Mucilaginibacter paludis]|uniref:Uncharacterized protein n=1 Tax=Mucilaginibacter paludis DSM 18603 TaxID=714943 RepID=H1Y019_9SPHI|nr:hypothetical protein [Mucilaginibacter paludis]EHQ27861.1 hypothetical protein Mucpa_3763 [Mucilaginibacter paludis DSM 18603]
MSKNKKGKVVSLKPAQLSPENYIKNNARSLPIAECLISDDWEDTGICNIIIARKHKTGNFTVGLYLVDLYCLGLKGTLYEFNISDQEYQHFRSSIPNLEKCKYPLAHNIVYGSIAYAEDLGFKPHKDFAVAQFILEEDDEKIELIDIEFGFEGKPCYIFDEEDNPTETKRIINTLTRTVGEGNFAAINQDDLYDDDFDDDELDDDDFDTDEFANYVVEEEERAFKNYIKAFKKINKAYEEYIRTPEAKAMLKESKIGKGYKIGNSVSDDDKFDTQEQEDEYFKLLDLALEQGEYTKAIKGTLKAIKKFPGKPKFYNILQFAYVFKDQPEEANRAIEEMYTQYPDYLFAKIHYSNQLITNGELDQVLAVFHNKTDLDQVYPDQKVFNKSEVAGYYACMCRYFTETGDIDSADLYMNAILKKKDLITDFGQKVLRLAIDGVCKAKMKILEETVKAGGLQGKPQA